MEGSVLIVGAASHLGEWLEGAGFDVTRVESAAGDDCSTPGGDPADEPPDCVVLVDREACGAVASAWGCPVLAVVEGAEAGVAAVEAGADDYVPRDDRAVLVGRVGLAVDAGRWRRSDPDTEPREQVLARLHEATRELMRAETERSVAEVGVRAAADIVGLARSTCFLLEDGALEPVANTGAAEELFGEPPSFKPGQGVTGTAFEEGRLEVLADGQRDERADPRGSEHIRSFVAVPIGERGVLTAASPQVDAYDQANVDGVQVLASNMEAALDRAARERTLAERERELERRNEMLESFTTLVGHDLRTPLSVARGHLEQAAVDCDHESIQTADAALDRMESLVADVLELARQGETVGEPEPVDLASIAREAWRTVDSGTADLRIAADHTVSADPERLRTLLENLFRNAVQHATGVDEPMGDPADCGSDLSVVVRSFDDGFVVADDGPGMPPAVRESAFDHGFTTAEDGTGFGLAIVKSIAEAHGWTVELAAEDCPVDFDGAFGGARAVVYTD